MSAPDGSLPAPTSFRRTVALSLTGAGRASRTELVSYALGAAFVLLAGSFLLALFTPYDVRALANNGLLLLLAIPVPALLVRRLHDEGRPGTLAWLALPGAILWLARKGLALTESTSARIAFDQTVWLADWLVIFANLALVILIVLPGTAGPNRFGGDPRQR